MIERQFARIREMGCTVVPVAPNADRTPAEFWMWWIAWARYHYARRTA